MASPKSTHLIIGDPFFTEEKRKSLEAGILKKFKGEIAHQTFHLSDIPLETVLTEARTLPFLTEAQIFTVRDLAKIKKTDLEILADYLNHPAEKTFLFLETEELDSDSELYELMKKSGEVHAFVASEKKSTMQAFMREKLKHSGKTMTHEAMALLEEEAGDMPAFLDSMIERLIAFAGKKSEITRDMVEMFEENWSQGDVFKLTDAISEKRTGQALALLRELLEHNERDAMALLGMLHWQIKRLWLARVLKDERAPESVIYKKCRISPRQAGFLMRQVGKFTRVQLEKALEGLFQLDWAVKTGRIQGPVGFESWVIETTSSKS